MYAETQPMPVGGRIGFAALATLCTVAVVIPVALVAGAVGLVLLPLGYLLYRLIVASFSPYTITIDTDALTVCMGWYRTRIPFGQITSCEAIRFKGWGLSTRTTPWQYPSATADANAVALMKRGTQVVFTTRDAAQVCTLIRAAAPQLRT